MFPHSEISRNVNDRITEIKTIIFSEHILDDVKSKTNIQVTLSILIDFKIIIPEV